MKLNLIDKIFIFIQGNVYLSLQMFFISYKSKTTSFWISLSPPQYRYHKAVCFLDVILAQFVYQY